MRARRRGMVRAGMLSRHTVELTAHAGLTVVLEAARAYGVDELVDEHLCTDEGAERGYSEAWKLESLLLLIAAGGECVEDIRILAGDCGLERLFEERFPSPDALHRFLASFHEEPAEGEEPKRGEARLRPEGKALAALRRVNEGLVHRIAAGDTSATIDVDATIIESHKRDALAHYKGGRGYQPVAAVWTERDLVIADEFRDGNVPAGMQPKVCAERALEALPASVTQRYLRGDSACYEQELLKYLCAQEVQFAIGADMSVELRDKCERHTQWRPLEQRAREVAEVGEVEFEPGDWPKSACPLRYVVVRLTAHQGELFGDGRTIKHLAIVSNRRELGAAELVRWYWKKAGSIEQVHDVMKNGLAAGVLPSGRYGANAAWYRINAIAYNVLSVLRREALPARLARVHPKRLRFEVLNIAGRITEHAGERNVHLNAPEELADEIIAARRKLRAIYERRCVDADSA